MRPATRWLVVLAAAATAACASRPDAAPKDERPAPDPGADRARPLDTDALVTVASDQPGRAAPPAPAPLEFRELFPGVRADVKQRVVEFDARTSPLLVADPQAPKFYLETIVCLPDTREHETLLVTSIVPSHLHAALLAAGFTPGAPGRFRFEGGRFVPEHPTGDRVSVEFVLRDAGGADRAIDPREWIGHHTSGALFGFSGPDENGAWVFAGSVMRAGPGGRAAYEADGVGVVIGLCCFGSETIAWSRAFSHDAAIDEPEWVARFDDIPAPGTPVRVRLRVLPE